MSIELLNSQDNILKYYLSHSRQLRTGILLILCRVIVVAPIPWIFKIVIDQNVASGDVDGIAVFILLCFGLLLLHYSLGVAGVKRLGEVTSIIIRDLRTIVFDRIQFLSFSYLDKNTSGRLISKYTVDTQKTQDALIIFSEKVIPDLAYGISILIILLILDWKLSLIILLLIPVYFLLRFYFWQKLQSSHEAIRQSQESLTGKVSELVSAIRFLRSMGEEKKSANRLQHDNYQLAEANYEMLGTKTVFWTTMYVITQIISLIIVCGGALLVIQGGMSIGTLVAYLAALPILLLPIDTLTIFSDYYYRGEVSYQSIRELTNEEHVEKWHGTKTLPVLAGKIEFSNVEFSYPAEPGRPILQSFNLTIKAGENLALVGSSGSGKSTLINLILGLYPIQQGLITIDGIPLHHLSISWLRQQCAIVMQETILLSGTIMDNLRFGNYDASDEQVFAAARAANAEGFILQLPEGYNTRLGERGVGLSGGQKQRIAIARAILRNPRILILDEATSSLDNESEYLIREALKDIARDRTVITIAHRLGTIKDADRIIVLHEGRIVEEGDYQSLIQTRGYFKRLLDIQTKYTADLFDG